MTYAAVLDVYTLEQILELNDKTTEDCLEYLVEEGYVELPRVKPLDFEWLKMKYVRLLPTLGLINLHGRQPIQKVMRPRMNVEYPFMIVGLSSSKEAGITM